MALGFGIQGGLAAAVGAVAGGLVGRLLGKEHPLAMIGGATVGAAIVGGIGSSNLVLSQGNSVVNPNALPAAGASS